MTSPQKLPSDLIKAPLSRPPRSAYQCFDCGQTFSVRKSLCRHTFSVHSQNRFPCLFPGCIAQFKRKDNRDRHEASAHGKGQHETIVCAICGHRVRPRSLSEHMDSVVCGNAAAAAIVSNKQRTQSPRALQGRRDPFLLTSSIMGRCQGGPWQVVVDDGGTSRAVAGSLTISMSELFSLKAQLYHLVRAELPSIQLMGQDSRLQLLVVLSRIGAIERWTGNEEACDLHFAALKQNLHMLDGGLQAFLGTAGKMLAAAYETLGVKFWEWPWVDCVCSSASSLVGNGPIDEEKALTNLPALLLATLCPITLEYRARKGYRPKPARWVEITCWKSPSVTTEA